MDLFEHLKGWIGRESPPVRAPGPVDGGEVRRYVNATGDTNPLWQAAAGGERGAPVPPAMVLDALRPAPGEDRPADDGSRAFPSLAGLSGTIEVPGETARLNAGVDVEWFRTLRVGDRLSVRFKILDIAVRATRTGQAVFITEERTYTDDGGDLVAVARQTTVRLVAGNVGGAP